MKNNEIQNLLERYRTGTLSDSEREELNRLTGRDEVMSAASRRADSIVRRRRTALFTLAGLLLAGTTVWTLLPRQEDNLVAETVIPETVTIPEPVVEQVAPARPTPVQTRPTHRPRAKVATTVTLDTSTFSIEETKVVVEETVVVCNNQCEADSVINDIWKFLAVL